MSLPTTPTDVRLTMEELRGLFLFESLDDDQLTWLSECGWVAECPAGDNALDEGEPAELVIMLLSGAIAMSRRVGPDDVEITRTEQRGVYAGAMQSYIDDESVQKYTATVRTITDARLFVLEGKAFGHAVREWFPMAIHLLEGLFLGMRNSQQIVGQRQQLLALGALTAGLTHELNNPAAAAVRANAALRDRVAGMRHKLAMLAHNEIDPRLLELLVDVQEEAVLAVAAAPELTALEESEREDELTDWLDEHGVAEPWGLAPVFASAGTTTDFLDGLAKSAPPEMLDGAVRWLSYTLETELLLQEITESVTRISSLVAAAKQYSHMDRAPFERINIHEGIKSTLAMLATKLDGIELVKDLDKSLPPGPRLQRRAQPGLDQPHRQRRPGDERLRDADDPYLARRRHGPRRDRRQRAGDPGRRAAADLRAVLHDQAGRTRHRSRARHLLPDRRGAARRRPHGGVGPRRHPLRREAAAHRAPFVLRPGGVPEADAAPMLGRVTSDDALALVARAAQEIYGLSGPVTLLAGERDLNARVGDHVVKIHAAEVDAAVLDFQDAALAHLAARRLRRLVPGVAAPLVDPVVVVGGDARVGSGRSTGWTAGCSLTSSRSHPRCCAAWVAPSRPSIVALADVTPPGPAPPLRVEPHERRRAARAPVLRR